MLDAKMGRKHQLRLVYVGQRLSHSRQRVEATDEEAHISEDAIPVASDDDETLALGIGHVFECKVWYLLWDGWINSNSYRNSLGSHFLIL